MQPEAINMKIAAVANAALRKEAEDKGSAPGLEWTWVDSVGMLGQHPDADGYFDLEFTPDAARIGLLSRLLPKPVLINSVPHTLQEIGHPFIRINAWPGFLGRNCSEVAVREGDPKEKAVELFGAMGWIHRFVPDIPGMISPRIVATIINEAYYTLQDKVSTREEIDTAMKLGTNYPFGPFEWSERIGLEKIAVLLTVLSRTDTRYAVAKALKTAFSD